MFDFAEEHRRFEEKCTACGECVRVCPIIPFTGIQDEDPGAVIRSVLDLYAGKSIDDKGRIRVYSCMSCLLCRPYCPEDLYPDLGLSLARAILRETGDPIPRAVAFMMPNTEFNFMKAIEAVQIRPEDRTWWTDVSRTRPEPSRTVLFTGCSAILQPDLIMTTLDLIRRIDPTVQALGGVDYCCGDTCIRAGEPEAAVEEFFALLEGLNAFSPEEVVFLCPTCKFLFDMHEPDTSFSRHFVTQYLADRLDALGPLKEIRAKVTVHDACHLSRGIRSDSDSPRTLLRAIPGVEVVEMEDTGGRSLCCGGSAMAAVGKPGMDLRTSRLQQAQATGADILAPYCPGCQSVFVSERSKMSLGVESVITLLGRAAGIHYDNVLMRYLSYHDSKKVLSEAEACINASDLDHEKLTYFAGKFFK